MWFKTQFTSQKKALSNIESALLIKKNL